MLEFLGFIALISIAFGISFGDALSGVFKFILFGILAIVALWVIAKMLSSRKGSAFVAIASVIFVLLGIVMINDNYEKRYSYCYGIQNNFVYASCVSNANDGHIEAVNKGWAYAICGGIGALVGISTWSEITEKEKRAKDSSKKIIEYTEEC